MAGRTAPVSGGQIDGACVMTMWRAWQKDSIPGIEIGNKFGYFQNNRPVFFFFLFFFPFSVPYPLHTVTVSGWGHHPPPHTAWDFFPPFPPLKNHHPRSPEPSASLAHFQLQSQIRNIRQVLGPGPVYLPHARLTAFAGGGGGGGWAS